MLSFVETVSKAFASPARKKAYRVMELLTHHGVRPEVGPRPTWEKDKREILDLLRSGVDLSTRVPRSDPIFPTHTILHLAAHDPLFLEIVEEIFKHEVEVDARNDKDQTAFHFVMVGSLVFDELQRERRAQMIDLFLKAEADVNAQDTIGNTVATWCLHQTADAHVHLPKLISRKLDVHATSGEMKEPLIQDALRHKNLDIAQMLRDAGASLDQPDGEGDTGLMRQLSGAGWSLTDMTQFCKFWPVINLCLDAKVNLLHRNKKGETVYSCVPWDKLQDKILPQEARRALERLQTAFKEATLQAAPTVRVDAAQPDVIVRAPKKFTFS